MASRKWEIDNERGGVRKKNTHNGSWRGTFLQSPDDTGEGEVKKPQKKSETI